MYDQRRINYPPRVNRMKEEISSQICNAVSKNIQKINPQSLHKFLLHTME